MILISKPIVSLPQQSKSFFLKNKCLNSSLYDFVYVSANSKHAFELLSLKMGTGAR